MGSEIFGLICGCGFGLLVMTVVGHGIWLAVAWCFKSLESGGGVTKPCPKCGSRMGVQNGRCVTCGAVPHIAPGATLRDELKITARQMRRLLDTHAITQEQYDAIIAPIQVELAWLAPQRPDFAALDAQSSVPAPAAQPFAPPVPPNPPIPTAPLPVDSPIEAELAEPPVESAAAPPWHPNPPVARSLESAANNPFAPVAAFAPPPVTRHPLDPSPPSVVVAPQANIKPGRSLADVLQSFMEESNIRWGEILAALLIVTSAVGLVISLRATLKAIPYFPALLFTLFTVAFHGAGMYTLRRWKLQAVSRVILIISLLLVPLTFSAAIVMSGSGEAQRPLSDPLLMLAVAIGVVVFGWVSYSASLELVGEGKWRLAAGVLGCSLSQIVIQRTNVPALGFWGLQLVAGLPLVCFLVATGGQLLRARDWLRLSHGRAAQILLVLGIATFALLAPLALLLVRAANRWEVVGQLSPALSLGAAAILALGLLVHHRATAKHLATIQTAGTAILVCGGLLLLLLVVAPWPKPELLLAVALFNAAILVCLAFAARLALLHAPGIACAAVAAVIGVHLVQGRFADREQLAEAILQACLMARTGLILTIFAGLVASLGCGLRQYRLAADSLVYLGSAGVLGLVSIAIAIFAGFVPYQTFPLDRDLAAPILLYYAILCIVAGPRTPWPAVAGVGSFLLWGALVQGTDFNATCRGWLQAMHILPARGIFAATLAHGFLTALVAMVAARPSWFTPRPEFRKATKEPQHRLLVTPLAIGSAISLCVVVPMIVYVWIGDFRWHAGFAFWAAAAWAMLAFTQRWPWAVNGLQVMLGLAPALLVAGLWRGRLGEGWLLSESHVQSQMLLLASWGIVWSITRRLADRRELLKGLVHPPWPGVDQLLLALAVLAIPLLEMAGASGDIWWELGIKELTPPDHSHPVADMFGVDRRSQVLLMALLVAVIVALWERVTLAALLGPGILAFAAIWTFAQLWHPVIAVASAARWLAAIFAVAWAIPFILREPIRAAAKRVPWLRWSKLPEELTTWFGGQPLLLGGLPVLILTILAVEQSVAGATLRGPAAGTIFARIGPTASYAGPLITLVGVLLAYAIRQRQASFALAGSGVFQLAINLAFLLYVTTSPRQPPTIRAIEWLQWNSLAAGAYALVWLGLSRWISPVDSVGNALRGVPSPGTPQRAFPTAQAARIMLDLQLAVAAVTAAAIAVFAAWGVFLRPGLPRPELAQLGGLLSYLAVAIASAAAIWHFRSRQIRGLGDIGMWLAMGLVALAAATTSQFDPGGKWLAYHVLEAGWLAVGILGAGFITYSSWRAGGVSLPMTPRRQFIPHHLSLLTIVILLTTLSIRGNGGDPAQPWWSLAATGGACLIASTLGLARRSQSYAYLSVGLAGLSAVLFLAAPNVTPWWRTIFDGIPPLALIDVVAIVVTIASAFWLGCENDAQWRRAESFDPRWPGPRVHAITSIGLLVLLSLFQMFLLTPFNWRPSVGDQVASVIDVLTLGVVLGFAAWDRRATWWLATLYLWGFVVFTLAIGVSADVLDLIEGRFALWLLALAVHAAIAGQIWSYGANLSVLGMRLGISDPIGGLTRTARWLPAVNVALAGLICLAGLPLVLTLGDERLRVAVAWAPAIAAWGVLCLAQERRRDALQLTALLMAGLSAVYLGWANIDPVWSREIWLTRTFRLLMVLAVLTFIYGLALPRWLLTTGPWNASTRRAGYVAAVCAIATFVAVLGLEVSLFKPGVDAPIDGVQIAAIAVVLVALIAGLLSLALLPGRDDETRNATEGVPYRLSENGRQWYVYAAEAVAALLFAHLYICRPTWFDTALRPYWPLIVMGIAFFGVGAGELCQRWRIRVLAEPLARTGALLPLLPVLGMWIVGSRTDYALLLFVVGLLYLVLSVTQKSWASLVAAAIAGNGALWALLSRQDINFTANPQFWLIPPALSVLIAAQVNRRRLDPATLTAIRYAATIVIYLSSTSEIFLRGIGDTLWPPMLLATLAVAGAFLGIILRIRAFLYLGSAFTLLALVSMVAHAARAIEHVWPWWAFGIGLGICILILFGIFEKKRQQMLALIARLRQWEQ